MSASSFRITANMITLVRIAMVPIPSGMLLTGDPVWVWIAFFISAVLGATDAVDGYLARRDGITVLGTLLDPLADKLFTAAFMLPIVALAHGPAVLIAAIFAREFLITGLRSSMALHSAQLKTSRLGKLKTVVQMGGLAVYVILFFSPAGWEAWLHLLGLAGLLVTALAFLLKGAKIPYWLWSAFPLWGGVAALSIWSGQENASVGLFGVMVALTWLSGVDYLLGSARTFRKDGLQIRDGMRIIWGLTHGVAPVFAIGMQPGLVVPAMLGMSLNLALGGVDNIVSAEKNEGVRRGFWETTLCAWVLWYSVSPWGALGGQAAVSAAWTYVGISALYAFIAYRNHRSLFTATLP